MSDAEWKGCQLGDVVSLVIDYRGKTPKKLGGDWNSSGYRALSAKNIKTGKIVQEESIRFVDEELYKIWMKDEVERGDILITSEAPFGQIYYWDSEEKIVLSQRLFALRIKEKFFPKYIYYYMTSKDFQKELDGRATGTTVTGLRQPELMKCNIRYPSLTQQKDIAKILSSLDDKIEINNAINRNLEKQAQAIFKSWFIDFEPFGGEMPEDWKETTLGEVCLKVTDGSHFSPQDDPSAPYPMFSVKDMETYGFNPTNCKHISAEDFEKMKAGDCVPKIDDVLVAKDGSYLKEIFICSEAREEAILSSIAIFRPNKDKILPEILLFLLKQPSVRKDVGDNFVSGSALPRIVLKDFKKYRFILPSMQIQQKLAKMLNSIRMEIHKNVDENQRLSVLRDSLLPRLMSGELGC